MQQGVRDLNVSLELAYPQREEKILKTKYRALICFVLFIHSCGGFVVWGFFLGFCF